MAPISNQKTGIKTYQMSKRILAKYYIIFINESERKAQLRCIRKISMTAFFFVSAKLNGVVTSDGFDLLSHLRPKKKSLLMDSKKSKLLFQFEETSSKAAWE